MYKLTGYRKIVFIHDGYIFTHMTTDTENILQRINELDIMLEILNKRISETTEKMIEKYLLSSSTMSTNQNYLLSGIQRGPNPKNYIITNRGIEVVGEQEITPISVFLESAIQFANEPNRKIMVLKELFKHLQKMKEMTTSNL